MKLNFQKRESRREFIKEGVRIGIFSGFVLMSGVLGWRKISNSDQTSTCPLNSLCRGCQKLSECNEFRAAELKRKQQNFSPKTGPGSLDIREEGAWNEKE